MNKDLLIQRRTESSALDDSVRAQVAQISCLDQERVIKTVIKYGNERIELDWSVKILKLGLDLHYRQVTVAMQEDGRLVVAVGKMAHRDFLKWIKKKLAQGWQIYSCYEAGASGYWLDRKLRKLGVHGVWWSEESWQELTQNPALKDWMKEQLEGWRTKALRYEEGQNQLRTRIEALAPESPLPKGVGRYSWAVLEYEMKGWARFNNRRQVSSYTGLCPGVHLSNGFGKEGSINRCGNPIVRWILVETVWRLVRWQPDYPPIRQLVKGLVRSKRAKKRLAVMAARHLAIDLWRLATGQTTAQNLGLVF